MQLIMPAKQASAKPEIVYHKDGSICAKGTKTNGNPTGYWEWFRKDGTRLRSGHFEEGRQVGEWITYNKKGQKYKVAMIKPKTLGRRSRDVG